MKAWHFRRPISSATNPYFNKHMIGPQKVPHGVYVHIACIDVVRIDENDFYVLEDNVRTPSGVSYMLENREVMMRLAPNLFAQPPGCARRELSRRPARGAPGPSRPPTSNEPPGDRLANPRPLQQRLLRTFVSGRQAWRRACRRPRSDRRGRYGVHAHDRGGRAGSMCSTAGSTTISSTPRSSTPSAPSARRPAMRAYKAGNITIANAVGTGIADDKAIYTLHARDHRILSGGERPLLKNVPTWRCREPDSRERSP